VILVLAIGLIATPYSNDDQTGGRIAALESSVGAAVIGALMCFKFNASVVGFQFLVTALGGFSNNLTFSFGADGLSMVFLVLTLFTFPVCILSA
jgi:NADH:ubiquinone oxidoreductase subunit 4 (subunit M)